ncbi:MAG: DUF4837 family protein [Bacteroidetes bacterium]|nr:MAG: DUF4837 family protein [Bacteroidota bacterium]TAG86035.1 MAG: DUF4837 family protein [Bacteroidota bacterium]
MKKNIYILYVVLVHILLSCTGNLENENTDAQTNQLVGSKGAPLEMILVMNPKYLNDTLGKAVKEALMAPTAVLPQDEPYFNVIKTHPDGLGKFLRGHNNLMFLVDMSDKTVIGEVLTKMFTKETLEKAIKDKPIVSLTQKNKYANGQHILYLIARNYDDLLVHLDKEMPRVIEFFRQAERERLMAQLLQRGENQQKKLEKLVKEKTGISIPIPLGYQLVKQKDNFLWLRAPGNVDKNITISYGEYKDKNMFEIANITKWRNDFGFRLMNDTTIKDSYMDTQMSNEEPMQSKVITLNKRYTNEYRGLWCFHNKNGGGPFVSYAFYDEKKKRFYYIEGFVYAPGEPKRGAYLEVESLLRLCKTD